MSSSMTIKELTEYTRGIKRFPSKYGIIDISEKRSGSEIVYNDWNISFNRDISAERKESEAIDEIQIIFNLNHDIEWNKKDESGDSSELVSMRKSELCIHRYRNESTSMTYKKGVDFRFKSIQMPTKKFEELLGCYFSNERISKIRERLYSNVLTTPITPQMYLILSEIDCAEKYEEFSGIFLDGKIIELLGVILHSLFHSDKQTAEEGVKLDRKDVDLIVKLREDIQLKPAEDYNVDRIAEKLGISKSKLVRLFRNMYGTSIHRYVQEQRLEYAVSLFNAGYSNVTEVAYLSGYNNLSHFAKEFSKRNGITPKKYILMSHLR